MNSKKISGRRACDCDRRYKPRIGATAEHGDFDYYVFCPNCKARTKPVHHAYGESHGRCQDQAIQFWNDRVMMDNKTPCHC